MAAFLYVDDESVARVTRAARGALILGKDDCNNCSGYEADVRQLRERGALGELVVGKIVLTQPGSPAFKAGQSLASRRDLPAVHGPL